MTCDEVLNRLDDHVDGELDESARLGVEAHLASCPSCREEERRQRALLDQAARLPREAGPARDLWPGIARRLETRPSRPLPLGISWFPALAAAALLIALSSAVTAFLMRGSQDRGAEPALVAASTPTPQTIPVAVEEAASSLREVELEYERAAQALLASLERRGDQLSPETLGAIRGSLVTIDGALARVRMALAEDPGNASLMRMLTATHRKKIDVLRRVIRHRSTLIG
jgi:anti-sigma factor RsiW